MYIGIAMYCFVIFLLYHVLHLFQQIIIDIDYIYKFHIVKWNDMLILFTSSDFSLINLFNYLLCILGEVARDLLLN